MPALQAAEFETPAAIQAAIRAALGARIAALPDATAEIAPIDPRLHLPACPALAVSLPGTGGPAMTARIACPSPSWTIYVPIRLHAWTEAVVAASNLAPRTRLSAGNIARGRVDMFASQGELIHEPANAEGEVLEVGLLAGAPILKSYLEAPILVHRGDRVLLTLTDRTMVLRDSAVALDDGRPGEVIAVQNPESRKIVHGTVAADGTVAVRF